jgi:hypothetical protein
MVDENKINVSDLKFFKLVDSSEEAMNHILEVHKKDGLVHTMQV